MAEQEGEKSPRREFKPIAMVDAKGKSVDEIADAVMASFELYKRENGLE